jgi:phospholipid/cholesterol/gamma-HCH transport system substrate-binding protein
METRAHHILIGLFTVLAVGAALLFTLWLGKSGHDRQYALYDIVFHEPVTGLSRGSTVEFNGIRIGDVAGLRLDPVDPRRVLARVRVESAAPVRSDTQARLVPAGITGLSIIRLTSGDDPSATPLLAADDAVPAIIAQPSPLSRLLADGEDVMFNVNELLLRVRDVLSPHVIEDLAATLHNLRLVTDTLSERRDDVAMVLNQTGRLLESANHIVDEELNDTLASAGRAMGALERTMGEIEHVVAANRGNLDGGLRGLADIGPAMSELRATLASLRSITRQLEDSPGDYLLGRQPTREFQP